MTAVYGDADAIVGSFVETWLERGSQRVESSPQGHLGAMMGRALRTGVLRKVDEQTSDGFHTFAELYRHRMLLAALLFCAFGAMDEAEVYKTRKHHPDDADPMFDGMFKVGATLPTGEIAYHFPVEAWHLFVIPERDHSPLWDGFTSADVADRLQAWLECGQ